MKNKHIKMIFCAILLVMAAGFGFAYYWESKIEKISYADFLAMVENGNVSSVSFSEKNLDVVLKDGTELRTVNPQNPFLAEKLLLNGVELLRENSLTDILSIVFDCIFYGIFIFVFILIFRKIINPNTFRVIRHTKVHFDDIAGMDDLKRHMMQIAQVMKNPAKAAKMGIRVPKGILLEGGPGNGKTLFARALAEEAGVNFIPTKATDFESMFMAIGPMKVKMLFRKARKNAPCIVFIDEFDGIGTRRNYSGSAIETENTRIVTALLNELDGFEPKSGVLVLAATNSREALDEALIRPGRFDAKYTVPYPDERSRLLLINMYSKDKILGSTCSKETLAGKFKGFSAAKIESVLNRAAMLAAQNGNPEISMENINAAIDEM